MASSVLHEWFSNPGPTGPSYGPIGPSYQESVNSFKDGSPLLKKTWFYPDNPFTSWKFMSLSAIAKRILDPNYRKLNKAKFLDSELELTQRGYQALGGLMLEKNLTEMVALAEKEIEEQDSKK